MQKLMHKPFLKYNKKASNYLEAFFIFGQTKKTIIC